MQKGILIGKYLDSAVFTFERFEVRGSRFRECFTGKDRLSGGSLVSRMLTTNIPLPVSVRFQPIGSAPILKKRVFTISASSRFSVVLNFLRKKLGVKESDGLFLYINSVFAPGLDEGVGNLFRVGRVLFSKNRAWLAEGW